LLLVGGVVIESSNSPAGQFNLQTAPLRRHERGRLKLNGDKRGRSLIAGLEWNARESGLQLAPPLVEGRDRVAFGLTKFSDGQFRVMKALQSFPPLPDELGVG